MTAVMNKGLAIAACPNRNSPMIDSHAHLDFPDFDGDRKELLQQMRSVGIQSAIIPAVDEAHWPKLIEVAERFNCFYSLGVHPWYAEDATDATWLSLQALLRQHKERSGLVAIGECGLDKLHKSNFITQMSVFEAQIELACEFDLPLIIHAVRAHEEILKSLKSLSPSRRGVIHGFYGSPQLAAQYVNLGYKIGVGGLLLNDNAPKLQLTVAELPIESFVLETDSPAMAPKNSQNIRNTPLILPDILQKIANLQKKSAVLISEQMFSNVTQLFDL